MAKRQLGIGKVAKAKKQKQNTNGESDSVEVSESKKSESPDNTTSELKVELGEEFDADDELGQLKGLWKTYQTNDDKNELILNGVIHECDRILRNTEDVTSIPDYFHSIYGLSLFELTNYNHDEKETETIIDMALERLDLGLEKYSESADLFLAKTNVMLGQIIIQHIARLTQDSSNDSTIKDSLQQTMELYEKGLNLENKELKAIVLTRFDDLLYLIDSFGNNYDLDNEDDDDDDDDKKSSVLPQNHPLTDIRNSEKYLSWWRNQTHDYVKSVTNKDLNKRLGQSYLREAEEPSSNYLDIVYGEEEDNEIDEKEKSKLQSQSQHLLHQAISCLDKAWDDENPDTWVQIAEAKISLANLYELESQQQEDTYKEAEKILIKANNVTNGKYQEVLSNLVD